MANLLRAETSTLEVLQNFISSSKGRRFLSPPGQWIITIIYKEYFLREVSASGFLGNIQS